MHPAVPPVPKVRSLDLHDDLAAGPAALVAGTLVVVISFLLVPVFSRIGRTTDDETHLPK